MEYGSSAPRAKRGGGGERREHVQAGRGKREGTRDHRVAGAGDVARETRDERRGRSAAPAETSMRLQGLRGGQI